VLKQLREESPDPPVIMLSGHGSVKTAVEATKLGAYDFIEKPPEGDRILLVARNALSHKKLSDENRRLRLSFDSRYRMVGESSALESVWEAVQRAAPTSATVLITGESGVGKELVARAIHRNSLRRDESFIQVNCAAIPEELIESELFGHEKGSFTGATEKQIGKFELAHKGTIFLDEIGDMSLRTQAKILRILQEHQFERVGGTETLSVDVRVIAATNKSLEKEIQDGKFREDLYYRLNVIPFHVPPLRERREDIPVLVKSFAEEFCVESGAKPKPVTGRAMALLQAYGWPGNVRELRNLVERLVLMTPGPRIRAQDLPEELRSGTRPAEMGGASLEDARHEFERRFLLARLEENGWNVSRTAEAIGLARESLSRKMRSYKLRAARE
jgi:two-component system nitrogen regulation response regulator NtrX